MVLKAMVVVCAAWSWQRAAAALLIGLVALLRPGEMVAVKREHRGLPCDNLRLDWVPRAVAYIVRGRLRRRVAGVQSVIVHEAEVMCALEGLL